MKTQYLSQEERERGAQHYLHWSSLNGLGFSFLGDTIVYLLAIQFGANNMQLGYISSIINVTGIALVLLPWLLAGVNLIDILFYSWLLRGLICIFYAGLFFLQGQTAVMLILLLYTLFCLFRTFGQAVSSPIQQMLSTPATIGELVIALSNRFQTSRFVSHLASFLLLSFSGLTGLGGYLILIGLGILTNTLGTLSLRYVPCRETVEYQRGQNIWRTFVESLHHRERALTMFVRWHQLGLTVILAFIIPFLRKIAHVPPNMIFLYTLAVTVATIAAGYIILPFTDRIGSRPVLILSSAMLIVVSASWSVIPATSSWSLLFGLGAITAFLQTIQGLLATRLELRSIPDQNKMGYVSMINVLSALASFAAGLFGGWLADLGEQLLFPGLNPFGLTFLAAAVLAMQMCVLTFFLEDAGSLSVKETTQILFSMRNLKAFLDIYQYHLTDDLNERKSIILSIGKSDTSVAVNEMRQILHNPLSTEKEEILKSLFAYPKYALLDDLLREAADAHSYHRALAIFALGAYPKRKVADFLLTLIEHPNATVRSTAAKSLARVGYPAALPIIQRLAADPALSLWSQMNYLVALSVMDPTGAHLAHLFDLASLHQGQTGEQTLLALTARMLKYEPELAQIFQAENLQPESGLRLLLDEAKQLRPFFHDFDALLHHYQQQQYAALWQWCCDQLSAPQPREQFQHLTTAIMTHDLRQTTRNNTLAVLYFTYQILR